MCHTGRFSSIIDFVCSSLVCVFSEFTCVSREVVSVGGSVPNGQVGPASWFLIPHGFSYLSIYFPYMMHFLTLKLTKIIVLLLLSPDPFVLNISALLVSKLRQLCRLPLFLIPRCPRYGII